MMKLHTIVLSAFIIILQSSRQLSNALVVPSLISTTAKSTTSPSRQINYQKSLLAATLYRPTSAHQVPSSSASSTNNDNQIKIGAAYTQPQHQVDTTSINGSSSSSINNINNNTNNNNNNNDRVVEGGEIDLKTEVLSLDLSKTVYTSSMKSPKDAYIAFVEKGVGNAKMSKRKIFHQAVLGGCYIGFASLLSLCIAGNLQGIGEHNSGFVKMAFAALFPVNLVFILSTGGQIFTGNSATVAAAKYEGLVEWRELGKSWIMSLVGNMLGCTLFALLATYAGLLSSSSGALQLLSSTAVSKVYGATLGQTFVKAILCNWMVSIAVFLAGASNDLTGKLVGIWFPVSTFVGIGLEHSVANMFLLPAALFHNTNNSITITIRDVLLRNVLPVTIGNAIAGALIVAGSYSYQFGRLGKKSLDRFRQRLALYEERKRHEKKRDYNDTIVVVVKKEEQQQQQQLLLLLPFGMAY
mmetsp:Transcript_21521/g.32567  ORF Transcript_21521/g.32567 Transcript_21521/m.32567 type:complete len:468 (+) Transcript_21521:153-1556(+)